MIGILQQFFCKHEFERKFHEQLTKQVIEGPIHIDVYDVMIARTISCCHKCKKLNLSEKVISRI